MDEVDLMRLLEEHTEAWNSHDLDRLMGLFVDDCVFDASGGSEVHGQRFAGRDHVRAAFAQVFEMMPDANWGDGRHAVIGDGYGVSEWTLTGTLSSGDRVEVDGCDFLTFRGSEIIRKNSYRKQRHS
jgi:uncharacterized protein (TIGR02246 family)